MTALSDKLFTTAERLLTTYGQAIAVQRSSSSYNPVTGETVNTSNSYSGVGYPSRYTSQAIDNVLIMQSDTLLIFSSDTKPKVNDVFTFGDETLAALDVQNITLSGSSIIYKVQLR